MRYRRVLFSRGCWGHCPMVFLHPPPSAARSTVTVYYTCSASSRYIKPHCRVTRTDAPEDEGRCFIITYHKADRTVVVREPPKRNSGIMGGNFLSRMKVRNSPRLQLALRKIQDQSSNLIPLYQATGVVFVASGRGQGVCR